MILQPLGKIARDVSIKMAMRQATQRLAFRFGLQLLQRYESTAGSGGG
jgi:hypothetical protein